MFTILMPYRMMMISGNSSTAGAAVRQHFFTITTFAFLLNLCSKDSNGIILGTFSSCTASACRSKKNGYCVKIFILIWRIRNTHIPNHCFVKIKVVNVFLGLSNVVMYYALTNYRVSPLHKIMV